VAIDRAGRRVSAAGRHALAEAEQVRTRIVTGPNDYLLPLLGAGEVDLVICRMAELGDVAGLSFEHLYSEQVVFVVRKGHALLGLEPFDDAGEGACLNEAAIGSSRRSTPYDSLDCLIVFELFDQYLFITIKKLALVKKGS
jgi:DNA-binding transcriptional LysR family regulator